MLNHNRWIICGLHLALILGCLPAVAQSVPPTLNYQGRLTDNTPQQNPVSATVPMQFEIWDGPLPLGSIRQWREPDCDGCATDVTVANGIFNYQLGSANPLPASLFGPYGSNRWLQIILNPAISPEPLSPRQRLTSTPFAIQAENAAMATDSGQLGGVSPAGYQLVVTPNTCPAGEFFTQIRESGIAQCAPDKGITGVTGGGGVTGVITGSNLTLGSDATVQRRLVAPFCDPNFVLQGIEADGTPACSDGNGLINPPLQLSKAIAGPIFSALNLGAGPAAKFEQSSGAANPVVIINGGGITTALSAALPNATGATVTIKSMQAAGSGVTTPVNGVALWGDALGGDGVYGTTAAAGVTIAAVHGYASAAANSYASGVIGTANAQFGTGVTGVALPGSLASLGAAAGVRGDSQNGIGVAGTSINNTGIFGESQTGNAVAGKSYGNSAAINGWNAKATGSVVGVFGQSDSDSGVGVRGLSSLTSGSPIGVSGIVSAPNGHGVIGSNLALSGSAYGVLGISNANLGRGVSGSSPFLGVTGISNGSAPGAAGVAGTHNASGNQGLLGTPNAGVSATASSGSAISGISSTTQGILGQTTAASGFTYGVTGIADSTTGRGVFGHATAVSGATNGVVGQTESASGAGVRAIGAGPADTALLVESGGIRVLGAGVGSSTAVFQVNGTSTNVCGGGNSCVITNNSQINGNPNAFLLATPYSGNPGALFVVYNVAGCTAGRWVICRSNGSSMDGFKVFALAFQAP